MNLIYHGAFDVSIGFDLKYSNILRIYLINTINKIFFFDIFFIFLLKERFRRYLYNFLKRNFNHVL